MLQINEPKAFEGFLKIETSLLNFFFSLYFLNKDSL